MQKVLILIGISGSGKSTFARQFCLENPQWMRVSRDEIRKSILPYSLNIYWQQNPDYIHQIEQIVTDIQKTSIISALQSGFHLLIDNTNLKISYLNEFLNLFKNFDIEISFKLFEEQIDVCIERDKNRVEQVGEATIKHQWELLNMLRKKFDFKQVIRHHAYQSFIAKQNEQLSPCIIVDIDGTVADKGNRLAFHWHKVGEDLPKIGIIKLVKILKSSGYEVIFVSGRDSICRNETLEWICKYFEWKVNDFQLFMRKHNDQRKDSIIKREIFEEHITNKCFVEYVIDDRDQVVEMWRKELGLTCLQVDYGNF